MEGPRLGGPSAEGAPKPEAPRGGGPLKAPVNTVPCSRNGCMQVSPFKRRRRLERALRRQGRGDSDRFVAVAAAFVFMQLAATNEEPAAQLQQQQQQQGSTKETASLQLMSCMYTCGALLTPRTPQEAELIDKEKSLRRFILMAFPVSCCCCCCCRCCCCCCCCCRCCCCCCCCCRCCCCCCRCCCCWCGCCCCCF